MRIILTGSEGFIGGAVLKALQENKDNKIYLLNQDREQWSDFETIEHEVANCDVIFHIGAISDTTLQDCNEMLYWNYSCSKVLFDLARKYDKKVVYSSSAATYGLGDGLPTNIYGWSKKLAEEYGLRTCEKFVALRYFNVYGPGEEHKGKMASVAYQAHVKGHFTIFPKKPKRDFVYIEDVVQANLTAAQIERGVFDVGYGAAMPFEDLVSGMGIEYDYTTADKIPSWYQYYTCANVEMRVPGWVPQFNVAEGTKKYRESL